MSTFEIGSRMYILASDFFLPKNTLKLRRTTEIMEIRKAFNGYLKKVSTYLHSGISKSELNATIEKCWQPRYSDENFSNKLWKQIINEEIQDYFDDYEDYDYTKECLVEMWRLKREKTEQNCEIFLTLAKTWPVSYSMLARKNLRNMLEQIYENMCISKDDLFQLIEDHLEIDNLKIIPKLTPIIREEISNYFDTVITNFYIRKKKKSQSDTEKTIIHTESYVTLQIHTFFKFVFENIKGGTEISQISLDPSIYANFSNKFAWKFFDVLWISTIQEQIRQNFDTIQILDDGLNFEMTFFKKKPDNPEINDDFKA